MIKKLLTYSVTNYRRSSANYINMFNIAGMFSNLGQTLNYLFQHPYCYLPNDQWYMIFLEFIC